MTNISNENIKRRADGSIDTDFYMALGRDARSEQAHHMLGAIIGIPSKILSLFGKAGKRMLQKTGVQKFPNF